MQHKSKQVDLKNLKKLVSFCQKNGILRYKSADLEIELTEKVPPKRLKGTGTEITETPKTEFPSWDSLTPEQKLLWSSTPDIATS